MVRFRAEGIGRAAPAKGLLLLPCQFPAEPAPHLQALVIIGIAMRLRQGRLLLTRVEADSLRLRFSLSDCVLGFSRAPR